MDLTAASIHDRLSVGPSIQPICTRCCFTMTNMVQMCSNFHRVRVFVTNTSPDDIVPHLAWGFSGLGFQDPGSLFLTESVHEPVSKCQLPHKFFNLFFILVTMKDQLTDLWGNGLLRNDFVNTFGEKRFRVSDFWLRVSASVLHVPGSRFWVPCSMLLQASGQVLRVSYLRL